MEIVDVITHTHKNSIKCIKFGDQFSDDVNCIPFQNSVKEIVFGYYFNQEIKQNVLPSSLIKLTFDVHFNKKIYFGMAFNQEIEHGTLPLSLTKLTFGSNFCNEIKVGMLPIGLKVLHFNSDFFVISKDAFPDALEELTIFIRNNEQKLYIFPPKLKRLNIDIDGYELKIDEHILPKTLKILRIGYWLLRKHYLDCEHLPAGLEKILIPSLIKKGKGYFARKLLNVRNSVEVEEYE